MAQQEKSMEVYKNKITVKCFKICQKPWNAPLDSSLRTWLVSGLSGPDRLSELCPDADLTVLTSFAFLYVQTHKALNS